MLRSVAEKVDPPEGDLLEETKEMKNGIAVRQDLSSICKICCLTFTPFFEVVS